MSARQRASSQQASRSGSGQSLLITIAKDSNKPWWWPHVDHEALRCRLDHQAVLLEGKPTSVLSLRFAELVWKCLAVLFRARRQGYDYILTFENGWLSFIVAFAQTLLMFRRPRHVILQFIMRERTPSLRSRVKYAFMKWCFSSVYLGVCSSRPECEYYRQAFGWPASKVKYAPLHTSPELIRSRVEDEGYVMSAGRTFRDYPTLLAAFRELPTPLVIVASPASVGQAEVPPNVRIAYNLPLSGLTDIMAKSCAVVVALEDRPISTGQLVLLQAMGMAKAIIATRTSGTVDYIEHMRTGILVPPNDPAAIRDAVRLLVSDKALRDRLGDAAQEQIRRAHLPDDYARYVSDLLREPTVPRPARTRRAERASMADVS